MSANPELSALQKEVTRRRILEMGFRVFAENTIEKVKMTDVAEAAGVGVATVYRYFPTKPALVLAISTWAWKQYINAPERLLEGHGETAAELYEFLLDSFLDLYRNHSDLLRFNQFFNVYVENEKELPKEAMEPYIEVVDVLSERFDEIYARAKEDRTLRTDIPARSMLLTSIHLMLAAVTRYAVGLIYEGDNTPEEELLVLKKMLMREYVLSGS